MNRMLVPALLAACAAASPAAAQWRTVSPVDTASVLLVAVSARDAPDPGTRPAYGVRGTLHRLAPDTLYLRTAGDSVVAVPRIRILRVEESLGVSRRRSAAILGYGFAVAGGLALLAVDDLGAAEVGWWRGGTFVVGAGVPGGATGALMPWERRERTWLPVIEP